MKILQVLFCLFFINPLYSQKKVKYKFQLPERDSLSFRPSEFGGTYKNGILYWYVNYEKDFSKPRDGRSRDFLEERPNLSLQDVHTPGDGFRIVTFRFQFFDGANMLILDTSDKFSFDLLEGYAVPPQTDFKRYNYRFTSDPQKVIFSWSFLDRLRPWDDKEKSAVLNDAQVIELYKQN